MTDSPFVEATFEEQSGRWWLVVKCPYCGQVHKHGAGMAVRGHTEPIPEMYRELGAYCFKGKYRLTKAKQTA